MTSSSQPPATRPLSSTLLHDLPGALLATAVMIATASVLWVQLGTLDPDSADIGGGPIGALAGGAAGAVLAVVDVARRGWHRARPAWALVAGLTGGTVLVLLLVRGGLDPFLLVAEVIVLALLLAPVALGLLLGHGVRAVLSRDR